MKPQMQRWLAKNENGTVGDCWRTCIASILEVDRDDVPNFVEIEMEDEESTAWWDATNEWLNERGFHLIELDLNVQNWAPDGYTILSGRSPRGEHNHCVVGKGVEVVHDPHPEGGGLAGAARVASIFVALNPMARAEGE